MGVKCRGGYGQDTCAIGWRGVACVVRCKKDSERDKKDKIDGEEEEKKNGKKRGLQKNQFFFSQWCSGESTHDPNQEGSESRPLDHVNLRKGST